MIASNISRFNPRDIPTKIFLDEIHRQISRRLALPRGAAHNAEIAIHLMMQIGENNTGRFYRQSSSDRLLDRWHYRAGIRNDGE